MAPFYRQMIGRSLLGANNDEEPVCVLLSRHGTTEISLRARSGIEFPTVARMLYIPIRDKDPLITWCHLGLADIPCSVHQHLTLVRSQLI